MSQNDMRKKCQCIVVWGFQLVRGEFSCQLSCHKSPNVTQLFLLAPIEVETPQNDRREGEELQRIAGEDGDAGMEFDAPMQLAD